MWGGLQLSRSAPLPSCTRPASRPHDQQGCICTDGSHRGGTYRRVPDKIKISGAGKGKGTYWWREGLSQDRLTPDTYYLKHWFRLLMDLSTLQCYTPPLTMADPLVFPLLSSSSGPFFTIFEKKNKKKPTLVPFKPPAFWPNSPYYPYI